MNPLIILLLTLQLYDKCVVHGKVVYSLVNPMFSAKSVGFGLSKYVYARHLNVTFDTNEYLDSNLNLLIRHYIQTKKETIPQLNLSSKCERQFTSLLDNFEFFMDFNGTVDLFDRNNFWSLEVFDSYGKMPANVLHGDNAWVGNYAECSSVQVDSFQGKHCIARIPTPGIDIGIMYGFCLPKRCQQSDVTTLINDSLTSISEKMTSLVNRNNIQVSCNEGPVPMDARTYLGISVLSIIGVCVVFGTFIDVYVRCVTERRQTNRVGMDLQPDIEVSVVKSPLESIEISEVKPNTSQTNTEDGAPKLFFDKLPFRILKSFSIYTNTIELFDVTDIPKNHLTTLDAIRVISLCWVILGHTMIFKFLVITNKIDAKLKIPTFLFQLILNGVLAVDTFFILSGFLLTYVFLKVCAKRRVVFNGKFFFQFYFHRFWRLTPVYMITLMISALFTPYMGAGPFYPVEGFEPNRCKYLWWKNLLYINNFELGSKKLCFGHSWYLANDMQFHWLSPLILIPLFKFMKWRFNLGILVAMLFLVISTATTSLILINNPGYEMGIFSGRPPLDYLFNYYIKPWVRIPSFLCGVIGGYILYKFKLRNQTKLDWRINLVGWIVSILMMAYITFSTAMDYAAEPPSREYHIAFQTFYKPFWAAAICFVIFSCNTGNGGFVNGILSCKVWIVISRLTYAAYLAHYSIVQYYPRSQIYQVYYTDTNFAGIYTASVVFSYMCAFLLTLLFEIPFIKLQKFMF